MQLYRKKPNIVEAFHWDGAEDKALEIINWIRSSRAEASYDRIGLKIWIHTLEGTMSATPNDYIIKGIQGEFYPCKPDIFESSYDKVVDV